MKGAGIALIVLGILGFIIGSVAFTRDKTVAEIGPIEIETETTERFPIAPVAAGAAVVAGLVLVIVGSRRRA